MRSDRLILLALALLILTWSPAQGAIEVPLTDDAYVDSNSPTTNFGTSAFLLASSGRYWSFLRFDLGTLPFGVTGADVQRAQLKLWVDQLTAAGEFYVGDAADPWDETTVTFDTRPSVPSFVTDNEVTRRRTFVVIDVTIYVKNWLDGVQDNHGFALVTPGLTGVTLRFDSKENTGTAHEPVLAVELN